MMVRPVDFSAINARSTGNALSIPRGGASYNFQVTPFRLIVALLAVLSLAAGASAQIDPKAAFLERDGFRALEAGDLALAADSFRQGLAIDPKNARLHLGAGIAAFLDRRDSDAKAALERALAIDPALVTARELLAQALKRLGDLAGAIRTLDALVVSNQASAEAREALDRWRRELDLHDRMAQAVGNHFTVSFEGPQELELATRALESLDKAYWRIGEALATYPSSPISVVLYTREQFHDITRSPDWAAGAYDGTIRVPMRGALEKGEELDRVLAHEFVHALVRTLAARGVPTWLNEGLAAAFEDAGGAWAEDQIAKAGGAMPLRLLTTSFGRLSGREAQLAYASSARAARQLIDEAGGVAVANLLRDLGNGEDFEAAFLHRIHRPFADFAR